MTGPVFVDTNVFVYLHDDSDPAKKERARNWIEYLVRRRAGRLSVQVLQELYAVLTRKVRPPLEAALARSIVRDLVAWQPVVVDAALLERAWNVERRYSVAWWDALIVAAAQTSGCGVLLTEDLQHSQNFGPVRVIDPFASVEKTPEAVLELLVS